MTLMDCYTTESAINASNKINNPTCIVIGCKNGEGNSNAGVRYYKIPCLQTNPIARQWYINTLREDLLDYLLTSKQPNNVHSNLIHENHYVCIEHFDEESFIIANSATDERFSNMLVNASQSQSQQELLMILKNDAVPSLFEIEVFQKMIAYQEQIAFNQQRQQQHQQQQSVKNSHTLLSNIILNDSFNYPLMTQQNQLKQTTSQVQSQSKRQRIDADERAALIQRVPKAVKRTSLLATQPAAPSAISSPIMKHQKAVKHTAQRHSLANNTSTINETVKPKLNYQTVTMQSASPSSSSCSSPSSSTVITNANSQQPKAQKAVKHTSNLFLKDIVLPPPIMQSTKRPNKAVKHTGGGSHSYYQSLNQLSKQNSTKPLTQISLNSSDNYDHTSITPRTESSFHSTALNSSQVPVISPIVNNKKVITTTYVYKRVLQQPEIDLDLECEEEEFIYIKTPSPPPSPKTAKVEENVKQSVSNTKPSQESPNTLNSSSLKQEDNNRDVKEITTKPKKAHLKVVDSKTKSFVCNKNNKRPNSTNLSDVDIENDEEGVEEMVEEDESDVNDDDADNDYDDDDNDDDEDDDEDENDDANSHEDLQEESVLIKKLKLKDQQSKTSSIQSFYQKILAKYYSRRQSTLAASLELVNSQPVRTNKRNSSSQLIPQDLRIGNYPAKCNICDIVMDNNIELTSHICSHLEGGTNSANDSNSLNIENNMTYISPFDAVTTTCGVCDLQFAQPFDLIKHLDLKHMKQLNEYKCRICEKQHNKLPELILHLNQTHSYEEMPYGCDACGFRTSFYADAIYHIKKEHTSTLRHFCPYCLKSLVLPYNEKLGHVQCNLFYSHLITHFNKHENDTLVPSKCKHCSKCILHVRNMRDHLNYDHNCSGRRKTIENYENSLTSKNSLIKYQAKNNKCAETTATINSKKRKRLSRNDEFGNNGKSDDESLIIDVQAKEQENLKEDNHVSTNDVYDFDIQESKSKKTLAATVAAKIRTRKSSSTNSSLKQEVQPIKMPIEAPAPPARKQKALKQTTIKKPLQSCAKRNRTSRDQSSNDKYLDEIDANNGEPRLVSATLLGNIQFQCLSNMFKCEECGDTNIRTHYRNEYTCHQCFYNTSCSNSFEYHLHGHLVSKRVALWNKVLKSDDCETYKCPCGFKISSSDNNNRIAATGNKIAAHLLHCEYKFCIFSKKSTSSRDLKETKIIENKKQSDSFPSTSIIEESFEQNSNKPIDSIQTNRSN